MEAQRLLNIERNNLFMLKLGILPSPSETNILHPADVKKSIDIVAALGGD
jgi:hypothetical protein